MSQTLGLSLWVQDRQVAQIGLTPLDDPWTLDYTPQWQAAAAA